MIWGIRGDFSMQIKKLSASRYHETQQIRRQNIAFSLSFGDVFFSRFEEFSYEMREKMQAFQGLHRLG